MADTTTNSQQLRHTPLLHTAAMEATAAMTDNTAASDGATGSAPVGVQWPSLSSVLLSEPSDSVALYPYPTFSELYDAAVDEDDDEDEHWLDMALDSTALRPLDVTAASPPPAVTSALTALRSAHRLEAARQQLSSDGWQSVKQQTQTYLRDSHRLPTQHRRPPSAADIATLTTVEGQSLNLCALALPASHPSALTATLTFACHV